MLSFRTILSTLRSSDLYGNILRLILRNLLNFLRTTKKLVRKMTMGKITRKKLAVDESRIWNMQEPIDGSIGSMLGDIVRSILFGYL